MLSGSGIVSTAMHAPAISIGRKPQDFSSEIRDVASRHVSTKRGQRW